MKRGTGLFLTFLLLLLGAASVEAHPSQLQERNGALAWTVGGAVIATFPSSMQEELVDLCRRFDSHYKRGFPLSDLRIEGKGDRWHIALAGQVLLPLTAPACRFHRSKGKILAAQWLSNLLEALVRLSPTAHSRRVTLNGSVRTEGRVSWFGGARWQGRKMANGEAFDDRQLTAAAVDLPFGTLVRLCHPRTGKKVVVRICDRFRGCKGRLLDVSLAAAEALGIKRQGVSRLSVEVLGLMASRVGGP